MKLESQSRHPTGSLSSQQGWHYPRLSEICIQDRRIVEPASDSASRLPYLGLEHIESNTGRILRKPQSLTEGEGKSMTFAFDSRHVLYGKLRPYLNKVALPEFEGRCTTELIPLLPREDVSREYLAWVLRRPATVAAAMQEKTGSRMPRANLPHVLSLHVLVPRDRATQDRIVAEFSERMNAIDRARHAIQEQLELLASLAFGLLQQFPQSIDRATSE